MNESYQTRLEDVRRFYKLLERLESKLKGKRLLKNATGYMPWPKRGVYFFFEPGEYRSTSGDGPRVVRVGTHALKRRAQATLWNRLSQHRGPVGGRNPGGGNHRGSVFRLHVGTALIKRDRWSGPSGETWGVGSHAKREVREREIPLERAVSQHIRSMPFLWLEVDDEPGPYSMRGVIERNAIALLSNYHLEDDAIDPLSQNWLGNWARNEGIGRAGLWNVNHVTEDYDPNFLNHMAGFLITMQ